MKPGNNLTQGAHQSYDAETFDLPLLLLADFGAGFVNPLAVGGTFLTFPELVFSGTPPVASHTHPPEEKAEGRRRDILRVRQHAPSGNRRLEGILLLL